MHTNQTSILLSDIVSVDDFVADIAADRIQERKHSEDSDLRIYSYTKKTQFGGLWTPAAKLARGLILRVPNGDFKLATVESRGLPKFFTVQQSQDDWGRVKLIDDDENVVVDEAPEIPWDLPAVVANKLNGALGLGYIDPTGLFRVSTKGSFGSLEATVANRVLDSKYAAVLPELSKISGVTVLFEIITPERPHPVDYGNLEDLIFLGTIDNRSGGWTPASGAEKIVTELGFPYAETHEVGSLKDAVALPYADNTEGFVVTVIGGGPEAIYKVKPNEYLQLRKLFYALQETELKDFVSTRTFTDQLQEIDGPEDIDLSALVGELKLNAQMEAMLEKRRNTLYIQFVGAAQDLIEDIREGLLRYAEDSGELIGEISRGEIAAWINERKGAFRGLSFAVYDSLVGGSITKANQAAVKLILAGEH